MKANQIYFYNTTVDEALEMLDMESRRDNAMINFEEFKVKLNKKGDHVMVTLEMSLGVMSIEDGIIQLKIDFPGKYRDMESIGRVEAVLALNPTSKWWKEILEELHEGYPLAWRVEEILIETEERIENPDEDVLAMLDQAIASNPRFRLLQSFKEQVLAGRELSERQMEILEQNLGSSAPSNTNQLARINEALALDPRNRFVNQLKQKAEQGITLSDRQMNVIEEIIGSQSSPAAKMLADLKANAYLEREDFMLINKGQRMGIDSLNDEERKRLRHLLYRNQRKLDNTYSKDEVRRLLKKGTAMRRLASEVIRDLEVRIARLEKSSGMFDLWTMAYPTRVTPSELKKYEVSRSMGKMIQNTYTGESQPVTIIPMEQVNHQDGDFLTLVLAEFDTEDSRYFILKGKNKDLGERLIHEFSGSVPRDMASMGLKAKANPNFRLASMTREAAGKAQLEGVDSVTAYHDGRPVGQSMSAMLYFIGADDNKSKFYEMVLDGETVQILYGRLGSAGRRADKTFDNTRQADAFFDKKLASKLKKGYVSAYSVRGEHRKNSPLYGRYPIGLTSNPGPWQNQDIAYDQAMITDTISVVRAAIASFQDDRIVDERAIAMLMSTQRSLGLNRDQLSQECAKEIGLALDRIQGTGRAGRQPVEVRTRTAIEGLLKLMRKLEGAMSGGHRRASLRRASRYSQNEINEMLDDAYVFHDYPEVDDAQNIIDALAEMMEDGRTSDADLDKALDDLYSLSDRYPLERSTANAVKKALEILTD